MTCLQNDDVRKLRDRVLLKAVAMFCCATVASAMVLSTSFSSASEPLSEHVAALQGSWELRIDGGGEIYYATMAIEAGDGTDNAATGWFKSDGRKVKIDSIRWDKGIFFVEAQTRRRSMPTAVAIALELVDGRLVGDIDFDSGTNVRSYPVEATRRELSAVATAKEEPKATDDVPNPSEKPTLHTRQATHRLSFVQGVDGYDGTVDTEIWAVAPNTPLDRQETMTADGNNGGGESQVLIRFDNLIGDGEKLVPKNCRILSAKLTIVAFDPGSTVYLHRVLVPWTAAATWKRMASGMTVDNIEASTVRDGFTFGEINMDKQLVEFDVTATVQKWATGAPNFGWVFVSTGGNGWDFYSSNAIEQDTRPSLEIEFAPSQNGGAPGDAPQSLASQSLTLRNE